MDEVEYLHALRVLKVLPCSSYNAPRGKIENFTIKNSVGGGGSRRAKGKISTVYSETQYRHWIYVKIVSPTSSIFSSSIFRGE